jgi:hypothetical protein
LRLVSAHDDHDAPRPSPGEIVTLLVPVRGVSGQTYPPGTEVWVPGGGVRFEGSVDGFRGGDWIPMRWWEFSTGVTGAD